MTFLFGSLILDSAGVVAELALPDKNAATVAGQHVPSRSSGKWQEAFSDIHESEILMPTRCKNLMLRSTSIYALGYLMRRLETLDSEHLDKRQLYKLEVLLADMPVDYTSCSVVNMVSSNSATTTGGFYLLSNGVPLNVYVIFDAQDRNTRLAWCTHDLKTFLRKEVHPTRYAFYQMPTLLDMPLFIQTQNVCSRWYALTKVFGTTRESLLTACNALEVMLYKHENPRLDTVS